MSCLPEELTLEILSRLPAKSLLCLTAVCKSWRSHITSSEFMSLHLLKSEFKLFLKSYGEGEQYTLLKDEGNLTLNSPLELDCPFPFQYGFCVEILGAVDGLLCLHHALYDDELHPYLFEPMILWNPCIRKHVVLPPPTIKVEGRSCILGFGTTGGDYKVVRVNENFDSSSADVEIYSLNLGTGKITHFDDWCVTKSFSRFHASVEGRIHWLADDMVKSPASLVSISSFHLENEVFEEILLPDNLPMIGKIITVVGGSLCLIGEKWIPCCVWVMKEYGVINSWSKLYNLEFDWLPPCTTVDFVCFRKNGELLLAIDEIKDDKLMSYDAKTRQYEDMGFRSYPCSFRAYNYVESLVLLAGPNVVADNYEQESSLTRDVTQVDV